jgi:predicted transglutaminase-like cysteine proteinase
MKLTWRMTFVLIAVLGTLSATIVTVIGLEPAGDAPMDGGHPLTWHSTYRDGGVTVRETIDLGITEEEYLRAAEEAHVRHGSVLIAVPTAFADPDNPYIIRIADRINELTEDCDELTRATVAAHFVQTAIEYASDKEMHGTSDYWATPLETLYLGKGDCEDSATLLLSIYMAMGLECALLDYDSHIDTAVRIDGKWRLCHASSQYTYRLTKDLTINGEYPDIYRPEDAPDAFIWFSDGLARYRQGIKDTIGI